MKYHTLTYVTNSFTSILPTCDPNCTSTVSTIASESWHRFYRAMPLVTCIDQVQKKKNKLDFLTCSQNSKFCKGTSSFWATIVESTISWRKFSLKKIYIDQRHHTVNIHHVLDSQLYTTTHLVKNPAAEIFPMSYIRNKTEMYKQTCHQIQVPREIDTKRLTSNMLLNSWTAKERNSTHKLLLVDHAIVLKVHCCENFREDILSKIWKIQYWRKLQTRGKQITRQHTEIHTRATYTTEGIQWHGFWASTNKVKREKEIA